MKYSITISDLTGYEVRDVINTLNDEAEAQAGDPISANIEQPAELSPVISPAQTTIVAAVEADLIPPAAPSMGIIAKAEAADAAKAETDTTGLPWDERIHSSSHKQTNKGAWSKRKNLAKGVFDEVSAELRNAPEPANNELDVNAFLARQAPAVAPVAIPAVIATDIPSVAPPPTIPGAVIPVVPAVRDFQGLIQQIASQHITPEYLIDLVNRINAGFNTNIVALTDVANDAGMVEYAWKCLELDGKAA